MVPTAEQNESVSNGDSELIPFVPDGDKHLKALMGGTGQPRGGPTVQLKKAADELANRVERGGKVTHEDFLRIRALVALDLLRSPRPTARSKGLDLLKEVRERQQMLEQKEAKEAVGDGMPF
jgi:hypothetical protein